MHLLYDYIQRPLKIEIKIEINKKTLPNEWKKYQILKQRKHHSPFEQKTVFKKQHIISILFLKCYMASIPNNRSYHRKTQVKTASNNNNQQTYKKKLKFIRTTQNFFTFFVVLFCIMYKSSWYNRQERAEKSGGWGRGGGKSVGK